MSKIRTVVYYKNYFLEFFYKQRDKVRRKISWTIDIIERTERIPSTYFKHIENTDGLYEMRIQQGSDIYRVFCFFDDDALVIAANGFLKKSQKTPRCEIERALKIKREYENEKQESQNSR